jgi:hypothetical protein
MKNNDQFKWMKSKEINPYQFYFLSEPLFEELLTTLRQNGGDYKISTIGIVRDYDNNSSECSLKFENAVVRLNFSRINYFFKFNANCLYLVYGVVKVSIV